MTPGEGDRDRCAEGMADEMRGADALLGERSAERGGEGLEIGRLERRGFSVARQIKRQRGPARREMTDERAPAVEIGAEAMNENDRGALARRQPFAIEGGAPRGLCGDRRDIACLYASERPGACNVRNINAAFPRETTRLRVARRPSEETGTNAMAASAKPAVSAEVGAAAGAAAVAVVQTSSTPQIQPTTAPTGSSSPGRAATPRSMPLAGASISIAALSVSISNSGFP